MIRKIKVDVNSSTNSARFSIKLHSYENKFLEVFCIILGSNFLKKKTAESEKLTRSLETDILPEVQQNKVKAVIHLLVSKIVEITYTAYDRVSEEKRNSKNIIQVPTD